MGRRTYDQVLGFGEWPYRELTTYVFTHHPPEEHPDEVYFISGEVNTVLQKIRSENNTTIWLVGGTGITEQFLQQSLIDEYILFIIPIILGEGIPLFPDGIPEESLKLISAETLDDRIVKVVYRKR